MIEAISGGNLRPPPPPKSGESETLSDEQKSIIESTLSEFNSADLSQQDAISITQAFAEAGINPSSTLADILAENGFDAREIGNLAKANNQAENGSSSTGNKAQPGSTLDLSSILDYLEENSGDGRINPSDLTAKFGLPDGQPLIDLTA